MQPPVHGLRSVARTDRRFRRPSPAHAAEVRESNSLIPSNFFCSRAAQLRETSPSGALIYGHLRALSYLRIFTRVPILLCSSKFEQHASISSSSAKDGFLRLRAECFDCKCTHSSSRFKSVIGCSRKIRMYSSIAYAVHLSCRRR